MRERLLGQWVDSWRWTNSQHSKNYASLSLSSRWKPKSQEGNKSFVPELKKVVYVSRDSYACERSTYQFISRICIFHIFVFGYVTESLKAWEYN